MLPSCVGDKVLTFQEPHPQKQFSLFFWIRGAGPDVHMKLGILAKTVFDPAAAKYKW